MNLNNGGVLHCGCFLITRGLLEVPVAPRTGRKWMNYFSLCELNMF